MINKQFFMVLNINKMKLIQSLYIEPDLKIIKKFVKNCVENLVINLQSKSSHWKLVVVNLFILNYLWLF